MTHIVIKILVNNGRSSLSLRSRNTRLNSTPYNAQTGDGYSNSVRTADAFIVQYHMSRFGLILGTTVPSDEVGCTYKKDKPQNVPDWINVTRFTTKFAPLQALGTFKVILFSHFASLVSFSASFGLLVCFLPHEMRPLLFFSHLRPFFWSFLGL